MSDKLDPNDPMNRLLGAWQLAFFELHEKLLGFIDDKLKIARDRSFHGWLDLKMTVDGDRLIVRRALRAKDGKVPHGQWWTLPLLPNVVTELLERIKPAPPEEPVPDVDVDASAPDAEVRPSEPRHVSLVKQRAGEAAALVMNFKRTRDEVKDEIDPVLVAMNEAQAALIRFGKAVGAWVEERGELLQ